MNLTKCFAAGLCLTAMTASAVNIKANPFETQADLQQIGWWVGLDKTLESSGIVVSGDASLNGYTSTRPMTGVTSNNVLKLDTAGGVWTNTVAGASFPADGNKVFADMLVKFVPSEELQTIGTDVKLAVAVLAGTPNKLAVSVINQGAGTATNVWLVTEGAIDPNAWTRLTIEMGNISDTTYAYVKTNGVLVYFGVQSDPNMLLPNGSLDFNLNAIGFQGTGFIDEVVVSDTDPFVPSTVQFAGTGAVITDTGAYDTWLALTGNGLTRETVLAAQYNAYLMGVLKDEDTSPVLVVNSITVGGTTVLTVKAKYANGDLVNLGTLNNGAVINVQGKVNLSDPSWYNYAAGSLTVDPVVVSITNHFFKVQIATP